MLNTRAAEPFCCAKFGTPSTISERLGRRETCPKCDADLHTCRNCRFYSPSAHNECAETQAEWVREKDRANYCDYFEPRRGGSGVAGFQSRQDQAKARFEDLFKKK
jgi:hypothetical protein